MAEIVMEAPETALDADWLSARHTTAEELAANQWAENRTEDISSNQTLKNALGLDYETYKSQLNSLTPEERQELAGKSPDEVMGHLDRLDEERRSQQRNEEAAQLQTKEQREAALAQTETPELSQARKSTRKAYQEAAALDNQIAELVRLNELRDDPSAEGWDSMDPDLWRAAREGTLDSFDGSIANLIQQKQAKLAEAQLHQAAYHEGARVTPTNNPGPVIPIVANNGQVVPVTNADLTLMLQMELDNRAHSARMAAARDRYPDLDRVALTPRAADITEAQATFIKTLPNSADVVYHLLNHEPEIQALASMANHEAMRTLIALSHKLGDHGTSLPAKKTAAPKPPSPVGGSSSRGFDVNDESLSNEEWARQRNREINRRGNY